MPERRVDWHGVLGDIAYLGLTGSTLCERLDIRPALLQRLAKGEAPRGVVADRVVLLWMHLTAKRAEFLPILVEARRERRCEVPNLVSDDEQEPAHAQLGMVCTTRRAVHIEVT